MNAILTALIALIISTQHVTPLNAKYIARHQLHLDRSHPTCSQPPADNQPPALWYYMDGDGTPTDVAYSDYREDLAWYQQQYPQVCPITPEVLP